MARGLIEEPRAVKHGSALWILRGKDELRHPCETDRTGAHRAGFQRRAKGHPDEPFVSEPLRRVFHDNHTGVRCRITPLDDSVAVARENVTAWAGDDGADRDFPPLACLGSLFKSERHQFVICHSEPLAMNHLCEYALAQPDGRRVAWPMPGSKLAIE